MGESSTPGVPVLQTHVEAGRSRSAGPRPDVAQRVDAGTSGPSLPPLNVGVRHASLEHAPYRLLVGHFQGLPLSGAEARLNERSDGRLERLLLTNLYPQRLGEMVILEPVDEAPPQGVAILGLGPNGELTASHLRGVVTRALVRVALNVLDSRLAKRDAGAVLDTRPLGVSTVIIGSSISGGLTIEGSVRALVDGALGANATLGRLNVGPPGSQQHATDVVRYDVLEVIERYEDRVDLVVEVLAKLKRLDERQRSMPQAVKYELRPARGEGRSSANPPIDAAEEVWRRVDIRSVRRDGGATVQLEFTAIGRLARAERVLGDVERALIDRLVSAAIHDPRDEAVGGALFELLIPQDLKGDLGSGENLQLIVGEDEADLPWELLRPRPQDSEQQVPLALRIGLLRQFRESDQLRFAVRRASANNVLVIGNPPAGSLPSLAGAAAEANEVVRMFSPPTGDEPRRDDDEAWNVQSIIWPAGDSEGGRRPSKARKPAEALYELLNGDWRVIHIAAHGAFTGEGATTGVVLGDIQLTANVFSKLAVVPDMVVLNACHLGRVTDAGSAMSGANRSAASVARALVQLGVRAVVVAGWAVDDTAAERFASKLYGELLAGEDLGDAVARARLEAWSAATGSLTWGAYQCYGDPGFRLASRTSGRRPGDPKTKGDLRRRVQQLHARASDQGRSAAADPEKTKADLHKALTGLAGRAVRLRSWDILADLAAAWADLSEFERAIGLYERALSRGGSEVPLRAVEQLGNLQVREACRLRRAGSPDEPKIDRYLAEAERRLHQALAVAESGERYALLGSYHKKCATITDGVARLNHLKHAAASYGLAEATSSDPYHRFNALQLAAVLRLSDPGDQEQGSEPPVSAAANETESDDQGDGTSPPKPDRAPSFWKRAKRGDRLLTELLEDASRRPRSEPIPPETRERWTATSSTIVRAYSDAFRLRSSERERASVIDHVDDLAALLPVDHALTDVLQATAKALHAWPTVLHPAPPAPVDGLPAAASPSSASNEASPATGTDDGSPP